MESLSTRTDRETPAANDAVGSWSIWQPRLTFQDKLVEQQFRDEHLMRTMPSIRLFLVLGIALLAFFGILDFVLLQNQVGEIWLVRYGFICPGLTIALICTYSQKLRQHNDNILMLCIVISGVGAIVMTAIGPPPIRDCYLSA